MDRLREIVLPTGKLNAQKLWKREILYKGMNGHHVERIYVSPSQSYVFKPLTNDSQAGKEAWIYEHVLSSFPPFYPGIVRKSAPPEPGWIIFEDLGSLRHEHQDETIVGVADLMVQWHAFPVEALAGVPLSGPKPAIEAIARQIRGQSADVAAALHSLPVPQDAAGRVLALAEQADFSRPRVFSHGDLHPGNYARSSDGKLVVLDWEHAHVATPCWDLYHLLDMSHPLFPRTVTPALRERVLDRYFDGCALSEAGANREAFKRAYYLFSSLFSIWMLLLIQGDIGRGGGIWPLPNLRDQLKETVSNLNQCMERLF